MKDLPRFEPLEDRIVLDGEAQVTVSGPTDVELGAQDVEFTLTFDNLHSTDTGYLPFIDVVLPTLGPDGYDGVSFDSATFLGGAIDTTQLVFDTAGEAVHPIATDTLGDPLIVTGTPGETLLVFTLPYGSFSPGNPAVDVVMTLDFSDEADLNHTVDLETRAGFALGNDPLDNPAADPSTLSAFSTTSVGKTLFELTKTNSAPENEAATGPSYVYEYTLEVTVAPGQTLTDFNLVDTLPPEIVYMGNLTMSPTATINTEPTVGQPAGTGNNTLDLTFASIVGNPVTGNAVVTFDYYIDETAAGTTAPTIPVNSGDPASVINTVTGSGQWDPLDTNDPVETISATATNRQEAVSLAVQKSATLVDDTNLTGVISPDDVYRFTLEVQVSDYFTFGDLEVTDVLGNGWEYLNTGSYVPTLTTTESSGGAVTNAALLPQETTSFDSNTGKTTVVWDISQALVDAGSDAILTGDDADGTPGGASTTATITYYARILGNLTDDGNIGEIPFTQGDLLRNTATISASVRENSDPTNTLGTETDDTSTTLQTPFGQIDSKTVSFINGAAPTPGLPISAGDEVTFSIIYTAPLGSYEDLEIIDNLPQNVFDSTEITTFNNIVSGTPPAAGVAQFGLASQDYVDAGGGPPTLSGVPNDNQINYDFGTFTAEPRETVRIEILFTTTVIDAIFADGLMLTNQATAFEDNVVNGMVDTTAIANFIYGQPELAITKGVIATDSTDPDVAFSATEGPVTFTAPGNSGARFSGTISSDALDTTPIDADLEGIDAGDLVTFAIVVENTGKAPSGAFDVTITDTLPAGFGVPTGGLNLSVTDGTGTRAITYTGDLFSGGMVLDDRSSEGALSAFDGTSGENLVIITYDLVAEQTVKAGDVMENTATVTNFTAFESSGGTSAINRADASLTDTAKAEVDAVDIVKTLEGREIGVQRANEVMVGEEFTFEVSINLPEGSYENVILSDEVSVGGVFGDFDMLSAVITAWNTNALTSSNGITLGSLGTVANDNKSVSFDVGDLVNLGNNFLSDDVITFEVTAQSLGGQTAEAGEQLTNKAKFVADGVSEDVSSRVELIEPQLTIDKTAPNNGVRAGQTVTYTIEVDNPVQAHDAPAYDLVLTDLLDPSIDLVVGSVTVTGGTGTTIVTGNTSSDATLKITADMLDVGETLTISYQAVVNSSIEAGTVIDNTASLTFDSLPDDNASDERDYAISDDASVISKKPTANKSVSATSNPDTSGRNLAISETVTYDIVITLPEGTNSDSSLRDILPTSPGTLDLISAEVISIGSNISGSALSAGATGTVNGNIIDFDFGDLINATDMVQDTRDEILVRVVAQLNDVTGNDAGDRLTNKAKFMTDQTVVWNSEHIWIVEPDMQIEKSTDVAEADAGDTVVYTITATNAGGAPAYDIIIDDGITDPNLEFSSPYASSIRIMDGNTDVTPTGADAPSHVFPTPSDGLQAVIPVLMPGQSIEITYEMVVKEGVAFASSIDNTATVTRYDSDRAGDTTDPDDGRVYSGPSDTHRLPTPDPQVTKTLVSSDDPLTNGASVGISETLTYEIEIVFPEGISDVILVDALPAGLTPISAELTTFHSSVSSDNLAQGDTDTSSSFITLGSDGGFVFDFGTIDNEGDNSAANDTALITVVAQVTDIAAVQGGGTLVNEARLSLVDPSTGTVLTHPNTGQPQTFTDDATANVVEPELDIDKSVSPSTADAGDTVTYTILTENVGGGPAYDILLNDPLDDVALILPSTQSGTIKILNANGVDVTPSGADAPTLVYPTSSDGLRASIPVLEAGHTIEIVFDATIINTLTFSTAVNNTAEVTRFDSDPDGDETDADDGRVYDNTLAGYTVPTDTAVVTSPDVQLTKTVLSTGDTSTSGSSVAIGETITYALTMTLPEGIADLTLTDTLPTGLSAVSAEIVSIGSGTSVTTANINAGDTETSSFVTLTSGTVTFDFGTVTVAATDDAAARDETIVIHLVAQVQDLPSVDAGDRLRNTGRLDVDDPSSGTPLQPDPRATADVRVVEPELNVVKTGPLVAEAGDTVPYTVTVTNDGTGPAHDVVLEDLLSNPHLALSGTPSFDLEGTSISPAVSLVGDGFRAVIGSIAVGETLTVTYNATLSASAPEAAIFSNTASVDYDTVSDGTPTSTDGRTYSDSDDHDVGTVPALYKEATGSSFSQTDRSAFETTDLDLVVGEDVTFTLTLVLPEAEMSSVVLIDTLPPGLSYVSAAFVSEGAQISGAADVVVTNVGAVTTFDFGAVSNTATGAMDAGDHVKVTLTARVEDVTAVAEAASLVNTATLDVTAGGVVLDTVTASDAIDVVEPSLTIDKSGPLAADPGDRVTYVVEIENTGTGPAFDILVADAIADSQLTLVSGSVTATLNGAQLSPTVTETNGGFSFLASTLLPNDVLRVSYEADVDVGFAQGDLLSNTVTADFDTVPDGDPASDTGREESVTDTHAIVPGALLSKATVASSIADTGDSAGTAGVTDLNIGETVTYALTVTFPEIDIDGAVLVDTLPTGLSFVSSSIDSSATGLTGVIPSRSISGQEITFDFGAFTNPSDGSIGADDQVVILVTAQVEDVTTNQDAVALSNTATLTLTPQGQAAMDPITATAPVDIVTPVLSVNKSGNTAVNPGSDASYTVSVVNSGTGPAFDILVADVLDNAHLSYNAGSLTATIDTVDITSGLSVTSTATGFETLVAKLLPGETLEVTYTARLDANAPAAHSFDNTATITFDTVPDNDPRSTTGRTATDSDDHAIATGPSITKTVLSTDFSETGTAVGNTGLVDLNVGETVTYAYELTLPEIPLDSVVLSDVLGPELELIADSVNVTSIGAGMTAVNTPPVVTETNGQTFTIDFGAVNNPSDGSIGADDKILIQVSARVIDVPTAQSGRVTDNTVSATILPTGPDGQMTPVTATAQVEIVDPNLTIDKVGPVALYGGETASYTLTLTNTGNGPAYDVAITDTLSDANLALVSGSVSLALDGTTITPSVTETSSGFTVMIPVIEPGETLVVNYNALLSTTAPNLQPLTNTATAVYDTVPDGDANSPTGRTETVTDSDSVLSIRGLEKTVVSSSNPDTGTAQGDNSLTDLTIGEQVTYALLVTLPETDLDSIVITDTLPTGLGFVSASIGTPGSNISLTAPGTPVNSGQVTTFDLGASTSLGDGTIDAQDQITLTLVAVVQDITANTNGALLTNSADLVITPSGETPLSPQADTKTIEVVEPELNVVKTVSDTSPFLGDTVTYTVVVANDGAATAPIYNTVISDPLPFQLSSAGGITVSDPSLATVTAGSAAGDTQLSISVPRLAQGESVTITYDVFIGFQTSTSNAVTNVASVEGTSTPTASDPETRIYTASDPATFTGTTASSPAQVSDPFSNLGIDDAWFLPVLAIDPIYSGTAEPGSNVTIRLYGPQGEQTGLRHVLADAGGHWIAIFPRTEIDSPYDDSMFATLQGSRVFNAPVELLDQRPTTELASLGETRFARVGTDLSTESYGISLSADRPSTLPQSHGMFNARTFYASTFQQGAFADADTLRVDEVFEDIAGLTVQSLYEASANPLGNGLNRFNQEFLSEATATPGSPH
ncbi:isopeptide-forming domain-containing fimbrial protein [Thalassobacter stenotrophicus]|nr:isopeptide-forming domain-containing fimbrial protein [Thalassobacter stenotrophicus]